MDRRFERGYRPEISRRIDEVTHRGLDTAIIKVLGKEALERFDNASLLSEEQARNPDKNPYLGRYVPEGSRVFRLDNLTINNPNLRLPTAEHALDNRFSEGVSTQLHNKMVTGDFYNFYPDEVTGAKPADTLPGADIIRKSGKWEQRHNIYVLEDDKGRQIYAVPIVNEHDGLETRYIETYFPRGDDYSIEYHYYRNEGEPEKVEKEVVYFVEDRTGNYTSFQAITPIYVEDSIDPELKGTFQNLMLAYMENEDGKTLVVSDYQPHLQIISAPVSKMSRTPHPANPSLKIPGIDKLKPKNFIEVLARQEVYLDQLAKGVDDSVLMNRARDSRPILGSSMIATGAEGTAFMFERIDWNTVGDTLDEVMPILQTALAAIEQYDEYSYLVAGVIALGIIATTSNVIEKNFELNRETRRETREMIRELRILDVNL